MHRQWCRFCGVDAVHRCRHSKILSDQAARCLRCIDHAGHSRSRMSASSHDVESWDFVGAIVWSEISALRQLGSD